MIRGSKVEHAEARSFWHAGARYLGVFRGGDPGVVVPCFEENTLALTHACMPSNHDFECERLRTTCAELWHVLVDVVQEGMSDLESAVLLSDFADKSNEHYC